MTRHTISVLVENKFGVLARIAGLFSGRVYNIHSLNVAPSQDPRFSRMTIVVREKEDVLDQIIKHLEKLAKDDQETYREFYAQFSRYLKEGVVTSWPNKESLSLIHISEPTRH